MQFTKNYNQKGELESYTDNITGKSYKITDSATEKTFKDSSGGYEETNTYDDYGLLQTRNISGAAEQSYSYEYKRNSTKRLEEITVNGKVKADGNIEDIKVRPQTDVNGRNKGKEIYFAFNKVPKKIAEENICYRKVGDHATNMPGTIWYGSNEGNVYSIKESIKYAYDKAGNIEKVYENGELAVRYGYASIGRLIREDNKAIDKSEIISYDNKGNIIKRREYGFTLKDDTQIEEEKERSVKEYSYAGDEMKSCGGEICEYDVIGNPNIVK